MSPTSPWRVAVSIAFTVLLAAITSVAAQSNSSSDQLFQEKSQLVQSAVVRVVRDDEFEQNVGTGVLISSEGYVVIRNTTTPRVRPMLPGESVKFYLADGRKLKGKVLGWSEEWQIALLRIAGEKRWPYVEFATADLTAAGSPCLAASYDRDGMHFSEKPVMTIGDISSASRFGWFTTNCVLPGFPPIFDVHGRLVGITVRKPLEQDAIATDVSVLNDLWQDLTVTSNLDQARAMALRQNRPRIPQVDDQAEVGSTPDVDAAQIASRSTVRLRPLNPSGQSGDGGWSGVVISATGLIATCAHHDYLPREQIQVEFSDGRVVRGEILGSNKVSDIGIAKITEVGAWPSARLGYSQDVSPNDPCFISGYPAGHRDLKPLVIETSVVEPEGYQWSCTMLSAASYELAPGMSGGGVFNKQGDLIAVHEGKNRGEVGRHVRAEFIRLQWKSLTSGKTVKVSDRKLQ